MIEEISKLEAFAKFIPGPTLSFESRDTFIWLLVKAGGEDAESGI